MVVKTRKNSEEQLQRSIVQWATLRSATWPDLNYLFHPANGGSRTKAEAGIFKAMGSRAGVSDLHIPGNILRGIPGLWIELKSPNGTVSREQLDWLQGMHVRGEHVAVARTVGAAMMFMSWALLCPNILFDVNRQVECLSLNRPGIGFFTNYYSSGSFQIKKALELPANHSAAFEQWVISHRPQLFV